MTEEHLDLVGLLRGELSRAEALQAGDHLDSCADCRAELAETAVGHALLTGASRTLAAGPAAAGTASEVAATVEPELPPLALPEGRRWLRPVALVAAASALVAGTAAVTSYLQREPAAPAPVAAQTADLEPVEGSGGGQVRMVDVDGAVTMTVSTRDLPTIRPGEFYYVWLFNPKTQKMLPLGVVGPEGRASFELPESLVGRYQVVDVSLEQDDGDPAHSVTSVLRASYDDPATVSS